MTTPADARAVEEAFEACLAGRPVPAGAQGLAAFTDAVRAGATAPGRPNAALAELLVTGLLPDASTGTVGRSARSSRKRPRMILSTLVTKFVAAGAVAKAATAGGAVALALTGAATAQVLPGQDAAPAAVESPDATDADTAPEPAPEVPEATDGEGADGGDTDGVVAPEEGSGDTDGTPVGDPTGGDGTGEEPGEVPATDGQLSYEVWATGPAAGQTFSQWVRSGARAGVSNGATVSCFAHARNRGTDGSECLPTTPPVTEQPVPDGGGSVVPAPQPPVAEEQAAPAPAPTQTAPGSGNGGGNGHSGGNGGGNGSGANGGGNGSGNGNPGNGGGNGNRGR